MKKTITFLAIIGLFVPVLVFGQVAADANVDLNVNQSEIEQGAAGEITAEDLAVNQPQVLPNSPWYFLKSFWRSLKLWATFDPVAKAEKRLAIANERLVELKALVDEGKISEEQSEKILGKYDKEIEKLTASLEKIKDKAEEKANQLLERVTKQEFVRQRLMTQLEEKVKTEVLERIRERSLERLGQVIDELEEQNIEEKINSVFSGADPLNVKNLHNLQVLEELKAKVSEQAQAAILKAQTNALNRLGESFREMSFDEKVEKVQEFLESPVNVSTTERILEQTEDNVNNSLPLLKNIINQAQEKIKARIQEKNNESDESRDDQE